MGAKVHLQTLWLQILVACFFLCLNMPSASPVRFAGGSMDQIQIVQISGWPVVHTIGIPSTARSKFRIWAVVINVAYLLLLIWIIRNWSEERLRKSNSSFADDAKETQLTPAAWGKRLLFWVLLVALVRWACFSGYKPLLTDMPDSNSSYDYFINRGDLVNYNGKILVPSLQYRSAYKVVHSDPNIKSIVILEEDAERLVVYDGF